MRTKYHFLIVDYKMAFFVLSTIAESAKVSLKFAHY